MILSVNESIFSNVENVFSLADKTAKRYIDK